jgi:hypothetical protein
MRNVESFKAYVHDFNYTHMYAILKMDEFSKLRKTKDIEYIHLSSNTCNVKAVILEIFHTKGKRSMCS